MDCFCIQVIKDLSDHNRVLKTGNDSDITAALVTGFDINARRQQRSTDVPVMIKFD
jgi:hypothetical protein